VWRQTKRKRLPLTLPFAIAGRKGSTFVWGNHIVMPGSGRYTHSREAVSML